MSISFCETNFKINYNKHKGSFNHTSKRNRTIIAKYIKLLKDEMVVYTNEYKKVNQLFNCQSFHNCQRSQIKLCKPP